MIYSKINQEINPCVKEQDSHPLTSADRPPAGGDPVKGLRHTPCPANGLKHEADNGIMNPTTDCNYIFLATGRKDLHPLVDFRGWHIRRTQTSPLGSKQQRNVWSFVFLLDWFTWKWDLNMFVSSLSPFNQIWHHSCVILGMNLHCQDRQQRNKQLKEFENKAYFRVGRNSNMDDSASYNCCVTY